MTMVRYALTWSTASKDTDFTTLQYPNPGSTRAMYKLRLRLSKFELKINKQPPSSSSTPCLHHFLYEPATPYRNKVVSRMEYTANTTLDFLLVGAL